MANCVVWTPTASPPDTGIDVVAGKCSLPAFVELACTVERKRMRGDNHAVGKRLTDAWIQIVAMQSHVFVT